MCHIFIHPSKKSKRKHSQKMRTKKLTLFSRLNNIQITDGGKAKRVSAQRPKRGDTAESIQPRRQGGHGFTVVVLTRTAPASANEAICGWMDELVARHEGAGARNDAVTSGGLRKDARFPVDRPYQGFFHRQRTIRFFRWVRCRQPCRVCCKPCTEGQSRTRRRCT